MVTVQPTIVIFAHGAGTLVHGELAGVQPPFIPPMFQRTTLIQPAPGFINAPLDPKAGTTTHPTGPVAVCTLTATATEQLLFIVTVGHAACADIVEPHHKNTVNTIAKADLDKVCIISS